MNSHWESDFLLIFHVQIGQIFQKFECEAESNGGVVRNVVKWSIPNFLEVTFNKFTLVHVSDETAWWGLFADFEVCMS